MVVTIDDNKTSYEYGKNCKVVIHKIFKDNEYQYLFEYGYKKELLSIFSCWSDNLPSYYAGYLDILYHYIGFDRNVSETDVRGFVQSLRRYFKRSLNDKKDEKNQ